MNLHKIITKNGDQGETNLVYRNAKKSEPIIECIGTIDEANASIGMARHSLRHRLNDLDKDLDKLLDQVQNHLFDLSADLICDTNKINTFYIDLIEDAANDINKRLLPLNSFVLPKGEEAVLHLARTIVRRAERRFWRYYELIESTNTDPGIYLNRLSDLLFIICRAVHSGEEEVWQRLK
jgi:cob(I)alamin adenosyltransferase